MEEELYKLTTDCSDTDYYAQLKVVNHITKNKIRRPDIMHRHASLLINKFSGE